jgi:RNAse (barnase) inhibitor barstar
MANPEINEQFSKQNSLGREQAIALSDTEWWKTKTHREIAEFQMQTSELCCPFDVFHEAIEKTLGRPVFTHELGLNFDGLWDELFDGAQPPTFLEILDLIPEDKRVIVSTI